MSTHRERALGQARADLVALPDLAAEVVRLKADRHHDVSGYRGKVIGSPAPLSLPAVHLAGGGQHKPAWYGEDPRHPRWALTWYDRGRDEKTAHSRLFPTEDSAWDAFDRLDPQQQINAKVNPWKAQDIYHAADYLETWTRILCDEMPERPELTEQADVRSEAAVLLEHWAWIEQQDWADELAKGVSALAADARNQLGIRPEYRPTCRKCRSTVIPVDADRKLTSWEAAAYGACTGCDWTYPKGPALDALAQVQAPMSLDHLSQTVGVAVITLRRYEDDGLIKPTGKRGNTKLYDLAAVTNAIALMRERVPTRDGNGKFTRQVAQDA